MSGGACPLSPAARSVISKVWEEMRMKALVRDDVSASIILVEVCRLRALELRKVEEAEKHREQVEQWAVRFLDRQREELKI